MVAQECDMWSSYAAMQPHEKTSLGLFVADTARNYDPVVSL
jgi:hypothetical protein